MLDWIFRRNTPPPADTRPARASEVADAPPPRAEAAARPAVDWQLKLQHALGNDEALLALAREPAPVGIKLAAIGALAGEAALKQAERDTRHQDRRVHRLAKQRHHALVARRETAAQAAMLIDTARTLADAPLIAANRLVELDRAWQALDASVVDPAQRDAFVALQAKLASLARERGDELLRVERWSAEGRDALARLQQACEAAAAGTEDRARLAAACTAALTVLEAAPVHGACAAARDALRRALDVGAQLDERLRVLEALMEAPPAAVATTTKSPASDVVAREPEMPATDAPATDAPAEVPAAQGPVADVPAAAAPVAQASVAEEPTAEEGAARMSAAQAPATETPAAAVPATEASAAAMPAAEAPATQSPAAAMPATEASAAAMPAAEASAAVVRAAEVPAAEVPASHAAAAEEPAPERSATPPAAPAAISPELSAPEPSAPAVSAPDATTVPETGATALAEPAVAEPADLAHPVDPIPPPAAELAEPAIAPPTQAHAAIDEAAPSEAAPSEAAPPADPAARWKALPALDDARLAATLERRFQQWLRARDAAATPRRERPADAEPRARKEKPGTQKPAAERPGAERPGADKPGADKPADQAAEKFAALGRTLAQAESTLAAGHLADTHKRLTEIDALLDHGVPAGALRGRIDAIQAEYVRLKGWQRWSGGLARDELMAEAEALAASARGGEGGAPAKVAVKPHAERIDQLRARWKELDRAGGPSNRALWERFDAALKAAYEPVAVHLDAQRAQRLKNLEARLTLLEKLEGVALPAPESGVEPDWKALAAALHHFHTEWRKLGPIEHTVPHKEREGVLERMKAAVARIEGPLDAARAQAQREREALVERAQALAAEAVVLGREAMPRVRELQLQWQQHAKSLPLARPVENALWTRFKGQVDAVFQAREAAFHARDAEFKAHGAERAGLIERLQALTPDTPPAELKRTLAEVESQWQRVGPAPRAEAAALEARYRDARDAAAHSLSHAAERRWHATVDALEAHLARCEAAEADPARLEEAKAALAAPAQGQPALPGTWEKAIARRLAGAAPAAPAEPPIDVLLLQLEAAFQVESPPALQAARRDMKLQAMKAALEGRGSHAAVPAAPARLLADTLERRGLDDAQRERLRRVLAEVRRRGPVPPA